MNHNFAWELFKNTGNIDAYLLMKDVENETQLLESTKSVSDVLGEKNGDHKNEGNCYKNR